MTTGSNRSSLNCITDYLCKRTLSTCPQSSLTHLRTWPRTLASLKGPMSPQLSPQAQPVFQWQRLRASTWTSTTTSLRISQWLPWCWRTREIMPSIWVLLRSRHPWVQGSTPSKITQPTSSTRIKRLEVLLKSQCLHPATLARPGSGMCHSSKTGKNSSFRRQWVEIWPPALENFPQSRCPQGALLMEVQPTKVSLYRILKGAKTAVSSEKSSHAEEQQALSPIHPPLSITTTLSSTSTKITTIRTTCKREFPSWSKYRKSHLRTMLVKKLTELMRISHRTGGQGWTKEWMGISSNLTIRPPREALL